MIPGSASFTNRPAHGSIHRLEAAGGVDRVEGRQPLGVADLAVDLTEGGGQVDDARPVARW